MADYYLEGLVEWFDYWDAWHKWAAQCPSRWRLVKYIKWLRREPKYEQEINKCKS
jgi:hypothetical protein